MDYEGFLNFLVTQCLQFEHVFLVLRNHEFYGSSMENGWNVAKTLEVEPRLRGKFSGALNSPAIWPAMINYTYSGIDYTSKLNAKPNR
jgi:hypothetical protein